MRLFPVLVVALVVPLLSAPAAGEIYVQSPPDRAVTLVMRGHSFNGMSYPATPLLEAAVGELVQITVVVPPGAEPHTFHLHGHPWFLPSKGAMVDTFLLRPGDLHSFTITAGGQARAAGDWMYHCHFDDHVAGGMWGVFRVYPYQTTVAGAAPTFAVTLDELGVPVDGATLALTLDGASVPAHVEPQGEGRYLVHTTLAPTTKGVLVVHASHALGESVARVGLGGESVPLPTLEDVVPAGATHH